MSKMKSAGVSRSLCVCPESLIGMLSVVEISVGLKRPAMLICFAVSSLTAFCGCGGEEVALAPVTGFVTEGGKPMSGAIVEFFPETGRTSVGQTTAGGEFTMRYGDDVGVIIGACKVQITPGMATSNVDEGSDQVAPPMKGPPEVIMVSDSIVVKDNDLNTFAFELDDFRKSGKKKK